MNTHMNFVSPGAPNAMAMFEANSTAIEYSNDAVAAMKRGNYSEAVKLHQKALDLKLAAYSPETIQVAISYNGLGECLLAAGRLEEAEVALKKALRVRDLMEFGGLELGPAMDSAGTRDSMAQLFEAQGKWEDARKMRLRGSEKGQMLCGNYDCQRGLFKREQLKACSSCHTVFYDLVACQTADWKKRHKALCQSRRE